jgi:two-component system sensor histidine kinase/response regulator
MTEEAPANHATIMVVDDHPPNLKLLEDMLRQKGYRVQSFPRGRLALAAAAQKPPDLILLDINMQEMNGYEVCEQLKSEDKLARIPVIFLSALNETGDKVKAFGSGGVDYISKPFQFEEVQARVETHLELHRLEQALQRQNDRLEELVEVRTRQLAEAHTRLTILDRAKSDFLNLISHEFRTPLNGLLGVGELALGELPSGSGSGELRDLFEDSRHRMLTILDHAMLLTQVDVEGSKFTPVPIPLRSILSGAFERTVEFAASRRVALADLPGLDVSVLGEEELLVRAMQALLETAVKFSEEGTAVQLEYQIHPDRIHLAIQSAGRAIPPESVPKFFDLFAIGEAIVPGGDLGLGPPLALRILSLFGGSVSVENQASVGIRLTISLRRS